MKNLCFCLLQSLALSIFKILCALILSRFSFSVHSYIAVPRDKKIGAQKFVQLPPFIVLLADIPPCACTLQ